jgi:hypothetical protein
MSLDHTPTKPRSEFSEFLPPAPLAATAEVRFTPRNSFGVVDHYVIRPSGAQVYVPMRLIVSSRGCELLFTLFREPQMSDQQFAAAARFGQSEIFVRKVTAHFPSRLDPVSTPGAITNSQTL